jgi:hypothetical protein
MKKLKISEWINKIVYTNDEINYIEDSSSQYIADAITGSVAFQVQFIVKDMEVCLHTSILKLVISQEYCFINYKQIMEYIYIS